MPFRRRHAAKSRFGHTRGLGPARVEASVDIGTTLRYRTPLALSLAHRQHKNVHHGTNDRCIDKNYSGVLIVWDRVFGTCQREIGPIAYGVITGHHRYNLVKVMLGLLRDWARGDFARERDHAARTAASDR